MLTAKDQLLDFAKAAREAAERLPIGPKRDDLIAFLGERFQRWMLPDDVVVLDELPHTATGKVMKTRLREMYRDHKLPES